MIAGLNPVSYGRNSSVTAKIWMSNCMMYISKSQCQKIVKIWDEIAEGFINKREQIHNEWTAEKLKLQMLEILKTAEIGNKDEVKTKALSLGLGFVIPALMEHGIEFGNDDDNEGGDELGNDKFENDDENDDDDDVLDQIESMTGTPQGGNVQLINDIYINNHNNNHNHNHNYNNGGYRNAHTFEDADI